MLSQERKERFRLRVSKVIGGFSMAVLFSLQTLAAPVITPAQNLNRQANKWLTQQAEIYARQQGWQQVKIQPQLHYFIAEQNIQPCSVPLTFSTASQIRQITRFPVRVSCNQARDGWQLRAQASVELRLHAIVARTDLAAGDRLSAENTQLAEVQLTAAQRSGLISDIDAIQWMSVKRPVSAGQPLQLNELKSPILVHRDQQVNILLKRPDLELTTAGIAMQNGARGAWIRVKNISSGRVIIAKVDSGQQVIVTAAQ